jgi:hypothetical protein
MKRLPWKYLAGFIDGEGCIDVRIDRQMYVSPRLRITQAIVGREIIESCVNSYGGSLKEEKSNNPNWSDKVTWYLCGYRLVCPVLRNVVNHLILKKEQARLLLWMETEVKGKHVSTEVRDAIRKELTLMKSDAHRLSEKAQDSILAML